MKITLRPKQESDKEFCRQAHHQGFRDVLLRQFGVWDEQQQDGFFEEEWNETPLQIIEMDGKSVGCFLCETHADHLFLFEILVAPAFQGQGIGTELIKREQKAAEKLGVPLRLKVRKINKAVDLYRRLGFKETSQTDNYFNMEWKGKE